MKLVIPENNVTSNGVIAENTFSITASAKAFKILSSALYKDKVLAIIRELSCNAYDSHVDNGNKVEPFEIHLPTILNPYFKVRDFGTGISHEDMMTLYTTYFSSTKTDSNEFIGALGLGSKSPFSYTDTFNVTSYMNGEAKSYTAYIDDIGTPNISLMAANKSNKRNGIEVGFYVNEVDFHTFRTKIESVFKHFPVKPIINGYNFPVYEDRTVLFEGKNWKLYKQSNFSGMNAIQGNVGYPIASSAILNLPDYLATVIKYGNTDINFNIGDLEVSASREELSYDERTSQNIMMVLNDIYNTVRDSIISKIGKCATKWDAQLLLCEIQNTYPNEIIKHTDSLNLIYDKKPIQHSVGVNLNLLSAVPGHFGLKRYQKTNNNHVKITSTKFNIIPYSAKTFIVFNDVKRSYVKRLKKHIIDKMAMYDTVFTIQFGEWVTDKDKKRDDILNILGNPDFIMLSETNELPKVVRAKRSAIRKGNVLRLSGKECYNWNTSCWDYVELVDPKNIIYVPAFRFDAMTPECYSPAILNRIIRVLSNLNVLPDNPLIYGIRDSHKKQFKSENLDTFRNLFDIIDEFAKRIDLKVIERYTNLEMDEFSFAWKYIKRLNSLIDKSHPTIKDYLADKAFYTKQNDNVIAVNKRHFLSLIGKLPNPVQNLTANSHDKLLKQFPLFKTFNELCDRQQEDIYKNDVALYMNSKIGEKI